MYVSVHVHMLLRDGAVCVDAEVRLAALSSTPQSVNQLIDHISMF